MYLCIRKRVHPHPRHPGDIGDIGDIFRKSLKLPDFLQALDGDIPGDIFGGGDKSPSSPSRESKSVIDGPPTLHGKKGIDSVGYAC